MLVPPRITHQATYSVRIQDITDITIEDIKAAEPSRDIFATWAHGGANVEPSAKMLALVELLREWESTGDKTICFSQCEQEECLCVA